MLSNSKFSSWWAAAAEASDVAVVDYLSGVECPRFVDSNFNSTTKVGSLWALGDVAVGHSFMLQVGPGLTRANVPLVFGNHYNAYGFEEITGNLIDRCNLRVGYPQGSVTYQQTGVVGKGVKLGATVGSRMELRELQYLNGLSKFTLMMVIKTPGGCDPFLCGWVSVSKLPGNEGDAFVFTDSNLLFTTPVMPTDRFFLMTAVFDGTLLATDRTKVYIDDVRIDEETIIYNQQDNSALSIDESWAAFGNYAGPGGDLELDEARLICDAVTADEVTWRYHNLLGADTYWTATVRPVIENILSIGDNVYRVTGTGFMPDGVTVPTLLVNGVPVSLESGATDIQIDIVVSNPSVGMMLSIVNSDVEVETAPLDLDLNMLQQNDFNSQNLVFQMKGKKR